MESFSDYKFEDVAVPCYILTLDKVFLEGELPSGKKCATLSEAVKEILLKYAKEGNCNSKNFFFHTMSGLALQRHNILVSQFKHGLVAFVVESEHFPTESFSSSVRNSLSNIFATLPILSQKADDNAFAYIDEIQKNCYTMLRLTNNIETVKTIMRKSFQKKSFDVVGEIKSVIDSVTAISLTENIPIIANLPSATLCVFGNKNLFIEAFLNILRNSIQFSRDGNSISVTLLVRGKQIILTVKDNGIGIKEENMAKVFLPYFSADPYGDTADRPGLGIGLSNAKGIVESVGGVVAIESRFGKGTTVIISLPLDEAMTSTLCSTTAEYILNRYSALYIHLSDFYRTPNM